MIYPAFETKADTIRDDSPSALTKSQRSVGAGDSAGGYCAFLWDPKSSSFNFFRNADGEI